MCLLFYLFIAIISVAFIIGSIFFLVCYFNQDSGTDVIRLSFNEFYKYYCLNPNSWHINYDRLRKFKKEDIYWDYEYRCRIKFLSYLRYCLFVFKYKKGIDDVKSNNVKIEFLKAIQSDIDKCRKEAEKYNQQGIDIISGVINSGCKK